MGKETPSTNSKITNPKIPTLDEVDDRLRSKYMEILQSLSIAELKRFQLDKHRYKQLVISDFQDTLPSLDPDTIDGRAQCISNMLNNEAPKIRNKKIKQTSSKDSTKITVSEKPKESSNKVSSVSNQKDMSLANEAKQLKALNVDSNQRITRRSVQGTVSDRQTAETKRNYDSGKQDACNVEQDGLSESVINALQDTMVDANDSLNSTINGSFLDETYENHENINDSLTELKTIEQAKDNIKSNEYSAAEKPTNNTSAQPNDENINNDAKTKSRGRNNKQSNKKQETFESETDIMCIKACRKVTDSASIRCNMCMTWFHTLCVEISDINSVGAWVCADCRVMPETIKLMKSQINTLLETTTSLMKTFGSLSEKLDQEFGKLNDRITAVANKSKCSNQSSTQSMAELRQDIDALKTNVDKKTEAILSKSQCIIDKVTNATDLVGEVKSNKQCSISGSSQTKPKQPKSKANKPINEPTLTLISNTSSNPIDVDEEISIQNKSHELPKPTPQIKKDLTFITGSCLLKTIETRFLDENVRVKSYYKAKIETLQENLSEMDLSRYKNIILHIGGYDVDAKAKPDQFKAKYQSLLQSLSETESKIYISGLLPRGRIDIKPYNNILKRLSSQFQATFIDNHDSFIMASGELPFEYYQADRTNLKFPGTRLLVRNVNNKCTILPPSNSLNQTQNHRRQNHANFRSKFRTNARQPYRVRTQ